MSDNEKLIKYYETLINTLNSEGFKSVMVLNGETKYFEFEFRDLPPSFVLEEIAENKAAFDYLDNKGLIRHDMCYRCGESPISGKYYFIEVCHKTKLNICKNCHPGMSNSSVNPTSSGCLAILALPIIASIISWVLL